MSTASLHIQHLAWCSGHFSPFWGVILAGCVSGITQSGDCRIQALPLFCRSRHRSDSAGAGGLEDWAHDIAKSCSEVHFTPSGMTLHNWLLVHAIEQQEEMAIEQAKLMFNTHLIMRDGD